jgi:hypothetical protein
MASELLGLFALADQALKAAGGLREAGFQEISLMSPTPIPGVEKVLGRKTSAIKRFTFFGTLTGMLAGFLLAAGTAVLYLLPTGGRPIIPIPPYLVISYEVGILFGVLATLFGFLISARLPALKDRHYTPETHIDRFGILVTCRSERDAERARRIILAAGAEEVRQLAPLGSPLEKRPQEKEI